MRKAATEEHRAAMRRAETTEYGAAGCGGFPRIEEDCGAIANKGNKKCGKMKSGCQETAAHVLFEFCGQGKQRSVSLCEEKRGKAKVSGFFLILRLPLYPRGGGPF